MMSRIPDRIGSRTLIAGSAAILATGVSALLRMTAAGEISIFIATAVALAALASLVSQGTEQLGTRLDDPGRTDTQSGTELFCPLTDQRRQSGECHRRCNEDRYLAGSGHSQQRTDAGGKNRRRTRDQRARTNPVRNT